MISIHEAFVLRVVAH